VQLIHNDLVRYGEVLYFCYLPLESEQKVPIAVIKLFSLPDQAWLERSHKTYRTCVAGTDEDIAVVEVKNIQSVIAMHPDFEQGEDRWCAVYKPGRTASRLAGVREEEEEDV
jgi:hypothetical protein